jgi:ABC-type sugar transport system ATPase subunit
MNDEILKFEHVSKIFPGVKALDDISFSVKRGSVHALAGENGAGKSTLINILAGIYHADEGEVLMNGEKMEFKTPYESQASGISVVHQELVMPETLTVAETIFLGNLIYKSGFVDWKAINRKSAELLDMIGVKIGVDTIVSKLSVAQRQMVEICKAINHKCQVLIMDEPSATLSEKEQKIMFEMLRKLKAGGLTIIYISHRLEEIFDLGDEVTVLRDGKVIKTMPVSGVDRKQLISLMVGRELVNEYPKVQFEPGEVVLEVKNLCRKGVFNDINFQARKGEVLGFFGLVGAGRTEVAHAVMGIDRITSGEILFKGKPIIQKSLRQAVKNGFGLIPEDRRKNGLVGISSVGENICMVSMDKIIKKGIVRKGLEDKYSKEYVKLLHIAVPSISIQVQFLSGGNQQKVVISKWLLQDSDVIFLDEPTRGIDVGAKTEIYHIINDMVKSGKVVILISSELPEILGMCDRVIVMHEGKIAGELTRENAKQESIMSLAF